MGQGKCQEISEKAVLDLVGRIYEAGTDRSLWQSVLEQIAEAAGAPRALLLSHTRAPEAGGTWAFHDLGPEILRPYIDHFVQQDLWHQAGLKRGLEVSGQVVTGEMLIEDSTLFRSEFYNDYLREMGMFRLCTTIIHDGTEHFVPNIHLSLYRPKVQPSFSDGAVRMMQALYPHLKRALSINYRLLNFEKQIDSVVRATEQINEGAIVVNEHRHAIFVNEAADRQLSKCGGIRIRNGLIEVGTPVENARFKTLIAEACDPIKKITRSQPNVMVVDRSGNTRKLKLIICPTEVPFLSARYPKAQAIIFISEEPASLENTIDLLAKRYRLSNAEIRVLKGVTDGLSVKGIASHLRVSVNTVHSQLNSIYAKTTTHSQSQLMKLVMILRA